MTHKYNDTNIITHKHNDAQKKLCTNKITHKHNNTQT